MGKHEQGKEDDLVSCRYAAILSLTVTALLLSSCTSVEVKKVEPGQYPLKTICIQKNPQVAIREFLGVVEDGFQRHGIETEVFEADPPTRCEYVLTYIATRGWDLAEFLKHAELRLKKGNKIIGTAIYHHSGGFGFNKWASTASKMNPVIDELLAGFPER